MTATQSHPPQAKRLSDEAWIALDEDEPGELVDGVLAEEEMTDPAHGVIVMWLAMEPEFRLFEIYERTDAGIYARVRGGSEGTLDEVPGFPGLSVNLDAAWQKLDALSDD